VASLETKVEELESTTSELQPVLQDVGALGTMVASLETRVEELESTPSGELPTNPTFSTITLGPSTGVINFPDNSFIDVNGGIMQFKVANTFPMYMEGNSVGIQGGLSLWGTGLNGFAEFSQNLNDWDDEHLVTAGQVRMAFESLLSRIQVLEQVPIPPGV
jgi:hypothetical protein